MELSNLCAVVLAGGLGSRLQAVVPERPKLLAEVQGRPFLFYVLDRFEKAGLRRGVLCTGHAAERVRAACGDRHGRMSLRYSAEPEARGTAGALRHAFALLDSDPLLVANGDSVCDVDLAAAFDRHRTSGAKATVILSHEEDCGRYGHVELDDAFRVTRFAEKGAHAGPGWINAGIYFLSREVIAAIPDGRAVQLEYDVFPLLVGNGLHGCPTGGRFLDIGTAASYAEAESFFAGGGDR